MGLKPSLQAGLEVQLAAARAVAGDGVAGLHDLRDLAVILAVRADEGVDLVVEISQLKPLELGLRRAVLQGEHRGPNGAQTRRVGRDDDLGAQLLLQGVLQGHVLAGGALEAGWVEDVTTNRGRACSRTGFWVFGTSR